MAIYFPIACTAKSCVQIIFLTFVLALAMGCVGSTAAPTATPVTSFLDYRFKPLQLHVKLDPKESATILLNPSPLGKGGYSHGMAVTIDILPKQGWQVDKWVGPVYNIDGTTAQIKMDSSLEVAVRLIPTIPPTATPTPVPNATPPQEDIVHKINPVTVPPTPVPTATPRPFTPWLMDWSTATPRPKATPWHWPPASPGPTATPGKTSVYSSFGKAMEYFDAENWSMAVEGFTIAIQIKFRLADAYFYRGNAYYNLGQYQDAIADYTKTIKFDPDDTYAYYNRGLAYDVLGQRQNANADFTKAIADFTKAIRLDPNAVAYHNRGNAYDGLGQYQNAIADFTKAIRLDPDFASAYYYRGYTYWRITQKGKFREDIRKSCSLDSRYCGSYE